jgi:hypothetical protein
VALNLPFFLAQNFGIIFRGRDRMGLDAAVSVCNRAAGLVLALAALWLGLGLGGVVVSQGLAGAVALLLAAQLYRRIAVGPLHFSRAAAREILAGGTALLVMVVAVSDGPIDAVLLSAGPKDAVGWYGAARHLRDAERAGGDPRGGGPSPALGRWGPRAFRGRWPAERDGVGGGPPGSGNLALRRRGDHWSTEMTVCPGGDHLGVFGLGLFLIFVDSLLGTAWSPSAGRRRSRCSSWRRRWPRSWSCSDPYAGKRTQQGLGVVTAFVACEPLIFAGMLVVIPRGLVGRPFVLNCARAIGSALLTGALLRLVPPLTPWVAIPACIALYTVTTMALGLLRPHDVRGLIQLLVRELGSVGSSVQVKGSTPSDLDDGEARSAPGVPVEGRELVPGAWQADFRPLTASIVLASSPGSQVSATVNFLAARQFTSSR